MRGIVGFVLGSGVALAGCLKPASTYCGSVPDEQDPSTLRQVWCPSGQVCQLDDAGAPAGQYCVSPAAADACAGKDRFDPCTYDDPTGAIDGACIHHACLPCAPDLAGCGFIGWQPMASGADAAFRDVWVATRDQAYAVGDGGTLLRYDGFGWGPVASWGARNVTANLATVWASDDDSVLVAASDDATSSKIYWRSGDTWSEYDAGGPVLDLWGVSPTRVVAVGYQRVHWFDGTRWTTVQPPDVPATFLNAVWGSSATDVFAVGNSATIARYRGGTTWETMLAPAGLTVSLHGVWGSGPSDVYAVGRTGVVLRYDGTSWVRLTLPASLGDLSNVTWATVWGTGPNDVFVAGSGRIIHFDGTLWSELVTPASTPIEAIEGSGPDQVLAVGPSGTIWRYTGAGWSVMPRPSSAILRDVWGTGTSSDVIVVGDNGTIVQHADATGWTTKVCAGNNVVTTNALFGVAGVDATTAFAVGASGTVCKRTGATWDKIDVGTSELLADVTRVDTSFIAAGNQLLLRLEPAQVLDRPTDVAFEGIWASSADALYLAGPGLLVHRTGTTSTLASGTLHALWGSAPNDLFAVGAQGAVVHYDGAQATPVDVGTGVDLRDVWGTGPDDVFAAGASDTLLHLRDGRWRRVPLPAGTSADLYGLWGTRYAVYAVGSGGTILRLVRSGPFAP